MGTNNTPNQDNGQLPPTNGGDVTIEPLKPKHPSRTVKEIESLLAAVQVAVSTDLNLAKREILDRIREVADSVEIISREMARRLLRSEGEGNKDVG